MVKNNLGIFVQHTMGRSDSAKRGGQKEGCNRYSDLTRPKKDPSQTVAEIGQGDTRPQNGRGTEDPKRPIIDTGAQTKKTIAQCKKWQLIFQVDKHEINFINISNFKKCFCWEAPPSPLRRRKKNKTKIFSFSKCVRFLRLLKNFKKKKKQETDSWNTQFQHTCWSFSLFLFSKRTANTRTTQLHQHQSTSRRLPVRGRGWVYAHLVRLCAFVSDFVISFQPTWETDQGFLVFAQTIRTVLKHRPTMCAADPLCVNSCVNRFVKICITIVGNGFQNDTACASLFCVCVHVCVFTHVCCSVRVSFVCVGDVFCVVFLSWCCLVRGLNVDVSVCVCSSVCIYVCVSVHPECGFSLGCVNVCRFGFALFLEVRTCSACLFVCACACQMLRCALVCVWCVHAFLGAGVIVCSCGCAWFVCVLFMCNHECRFRFLFFFFWRCARVPNFYECVCVRVHVKVCVYVFVVSLFGNKEHTQMLNMKMFFEMSWHI